MFGSNNAQPTNDDPAMLDSVKQLTDDEQAQSAAAPVATTADPAAPVAHPEPAAGFSSMPVADPVTPTAPAPAAPTPAAPAPEPVAAPEPAAAPAVPSPTPIVSSVSSPAGVTPPSDDVTADSTPESATEPDSKPAVDVDHGQLADMKQHALDHLEPLVDHLDQNAEEEFKTTMMMIQSNDNHTLLEKALVAAKKITDDKVRAEALLDIINEINYFASQAGTDS